MDPRLSRLVELWSRSLESGLDASAQTELDALLQDGPLLEQFTQWQEAQSPLESAVNLDTPGLDAKVKALFGRRVLLRRLMPWMLGAALAGGGLMLASHWAKADKYQMVPVAVDDTPLAKTAESPTPTAAKQPLGLPPGYGSRPTRLELRVGHSVQLDWKVAQAADVRVQVVDARGVNVKVLWQGRAAAGEHASAWDGKDGQGKAAAAGVYRLVARAGGRTLSERQVEMKGPRE